jgi:hypothetical protein
VEVRLIGPMEVIQSARCCECIGRRTYGDNFNSSMVLARVIHCSAQQTAFE